MLDLQISPERDKDIESLIKDEVRAYRFQNSPQGLFTADGEPVDRQGLNVYLRFDDEVIGALLGATYWWTFHINWLWVAQVHRHQGYARQMLNTAIAEAKARGCIRAWGTVWETQGAATLYDKLGAKLLWRQAYPIENHALLYYGYEFD